MTVLEYIHHPERDSLVLLDIRGSEERLKGRYVAGSLHSPMEEVLGGTELLLDPAVPIIVLCERGGRAEIVTRYLRAQGYEAEKLEGGFVKLAPYVKHTELVE